jgi:hypothetical protein
MAITAMSATQETATFGDTVIAAARFEKSAGGVYQLNMAIGSINPVNFFGQISYTI